MHNERKANELLPRELQHDHDPSATALREIEARLAEELEAAKHLQRISTVLIQERSLDAIYEELLQAAMALMRSNMASLQLLDAPANELRLLAYHGFHPESAAYWQRVPVGGETSWGAAMAENVRVVTADVEAGAFGPESKHLDHFRLSGIRAMQSTPLVARDGRLVGMISTHWRQPHQPGERELRLLDVLARQAADVLERARAEGALRALEQQRAAELAAEADALSRLHQTSTRLWRTTELRFGLGEILDAVISLVGADMGNVQLLNPGTRLLEIAEHRGFEKDFLESFREVSIEDGTACGRSLRSGRSITIQDVDADEDYIPYRDIAAAAGYRAVHSTPLVDKDGQPLGILSTHFHQPHALSEQDLRWLGLYVRQAVDFIERYRIDAALRASLSERDALLKELHHRVKNNLQVIMSLTEMQTRQVTAPEALSALVESRNRVTAIAAIHEMLYQSGSFSRVDLGDYVRRLVPQVVSLYRQASHVKVALEGDEVIVDVTHAVPLGLLLNELVSNACKHAFCRGEGALIVTLALSDRDIHLRVADKGVGLPTDFNDRSTTTLGVQLVRMLTKQLGGTVSFTSDGGTTVDVRVPKDADAA